MRPRSKRLRKSTPTLAVALTRYLAEVSAKKRGQLQEESIAKVWRATHVINRPLVRITTTDLIRLRKEWLQNYQPATVVRRFALLSHLYTVARKDWQLPWLANPVQLISRPTVNDARDRRLFDRIRLNGVSEDECPRSELDWIIRATRSPDLPIILQLAVETGMRRSEITKLHREQIDFTFGIVHLTQTKNGEDRYVPLSPWAKYVLRRHVVGKPMRGRIFKMSSDAVTRAFIRARNKARKQYEALCDRYGRRPQAAYFHDLRLHDLRHEAASRLAQVFSLHELTKILGHKTVRMTLRYYLPNGRDLSRKLARSPLGKRQIERLKRLNME